jgi:hypothetical protein
MKSSLFTVSLACLLAAGCGPQKSQKTPVTQQTAAPLGTCAAKAQKVMQIMQDAFEKHHIKRMAELRRQLAKVDKKEYATFLEDCKNRAPACISGDSPDKELISQYQVETDPEKADDILKQILTTPHEATPELMQCLQAATVKTDEKGILVSGLVRDTNFRQQADLRPTRRINGWGFILSPQAIYACPGMENSIIGIADPKDAPWKIVAASTFYEKVEGHCQWGKNDSSSFEQRNEAHYYVELEQYVHRNNHTFFLIEDKTGNRLGWINMDSTAYFPMDTSNYNKNVPGFYRKGYAWYIHGAWKEDDVAARNPPDPDDPNPYGRKGDINIYDFLEVFHSTMGGRIVDGHEGKGYSTGFTVMQYTSFWDSLDTSPYCEILINGQPVYKSYSEVEGFIKYREHDSTIDSIAINEARRISLDSLTTALKE